MVSWWSVGARRHFSELQTFSQTAAAQVHPQCHSNICDCCSLRWIQRQWFSALSQAHAYSCGWHCESNIFGADPATPPVMVISIYGCTIVWQHGFMDTWKHGNTETRIHRHTDTRIHGCTDTWMHGCMDAWIHVWCTIYVWCRVQSWSSLPRYGYKYIYMYMDARMHGYLQSPVIQKETPLTQ